MMRRMPLAGVLGGDGAVADANSEGRRSLASIAWPIHSVPKWTSNTSVARAALLVMMPALSIRIFRRVKLG
jgi:hypothetical protein